MVLDNCFISDDLLAKEKGVCIVKGTRCCMRVNNTGQNQTNLQNMAKQVPVFHNLNQGFNQIPTLNLSMGFIFLTNGGDNYGLDRFSNYRLSTDVLDWHFASLMLHRLGDQNPASGFENLHHPDSAHGFP